MFTLKTVDMMWREYRVKVLAPSGVTSVNQIQETKKTFYTAIAGLLTHLAEMPADYEEEKGVKYLDALLQECFQFYTTYDTANNKL